MRIRYIRDWLNGNTQSPNDNWVEIRVTALDGTNIALGKTVTASLAGSGNPALVTNGDITCIAGTTNTQFYITGPVPPQNVVVDLGDIYLNIQSLTVWHWYSDGRTYHGTKTEVSEDGSTWVTLFDSAINGEYVETAAGHSVPSGLSFILGAASFTPTCNPDGDITESPEYIQATARSAGGVSYGFDPVVKYELIPLKWSYLPDAEADDLVSFITTQALFCVNEFTMVDSDGNSSTVELDSPRLDITCTVTGYRSVSLVLRRNL